MDNKMMELYLDNIDELVVEHDAVVTYKSLSKKLGIHVNTAKQLLYAYQSKQVSEKSFPINATYLLAGKLVDGSFNITIVNESDLKSTQSKFLELTSEHIYSIQKGKNVKDIKLLSGLSDKIQGCQPVIKCSKSKIKSKNDVRKKADYNVEGKEKTQVKQESVKEVEKKISKIQEMCKKIASPIKNLKENNEKSPKKISPEGNKSKANSRKAQENAKKSKSNISNFFTNASLKNSGKSNCVGKNKNDSSTKDENKSNPVISEVVPLETDVKSTTISNKKESFGSEVKTKANESSSKGKVQTKKEGSKRKRIQIFSDSEESDSNSDDEPPQAEEQQEPYVPSPPLIDDDDDEEEKEKEKIESDNKSTQNKRKKRKLVDKTVMNEDGYLETKKEFVFVTDSENEEEETSVKEGSTLKKTKLDEISEKSKSSTTKVAKKQASLLTFFKKN